jgi:DNA-binding NtrC family response regulator
MSSLPRRDRPPTAPTSGTGLGASRPPLDILLVDDEPEIDATLGDMLRTAGHAVTTANAGDSALTLLESRPFDVMICDVRRCGTPSPP